MLVSIVLPTEPLNLARLRGVTGSDWQSSWNRSSEAFEDEKDVCESSLSKISHDWKSSQFETNVIGAFKFRYII